MTLNKSASTNLIAILIIGIGYLSPIYGQWLLTIGFFSLSGAITNWLAVHMLFEKIPFLIGSGVIPNRFNEFRGAIRNLIINEFFTETQLSTLMGTLTEKTTINPESIANNVDHDKVFSSFVQVVQDSSFGGMLSMFGGIKALDPLKEPFKEKTTVLVKEVIINSAPDMAELTKQSLDIPAIRAALIDMVDQRLNDLTPAHVKTIVQDMIRQH